MGPFQVSKKWNKYFVILFSVKPILLSSDACWQKFKREKREINPIEGTMAGVRSILIPPSINSLENVLHFISTYWSLFKFFPALDFPKLSWSCIRFWTTTWTRNQLNTSTPRAISHTCPLVVEMDIELSGFKHFFFLRYDIGRVLITILWSSNQKLTCFWNRPIINPWISLTIHCYPIAVDSCVSKFKPPDSSSIIHCLNLLIVRCSEIKLHNGYSLKFCCNCLSIP